VFREYFVTAFWVYFTLDVYVVAVIPHRWCDFITLFVIDTRGSDNRTDLIDGPSVAKGLDNRIAIFIRCDPALSFSHGKEDIPVRESHVVVSHWVISCSCSSVRRVGQ
jgi:hypothetical protein